MAAEDAAVVVTVRANTKDFDAGMRATVRQLQRDLDAAKTTLGGFGRQVQQGTAEGVRSLQSMQFASKNLGFQLNDLATSIASGGGAMRAFAQQGGQITQIFQGMNLRTIGATFTAALLDPWVALPIAIGVATVAMTSFFSDSEEDAEEFTKVLNAQLEVINRLREARGLGPVERGKDPLDLLMAQRDALKAQAEAAELVAKKLQEIRTSIFENVPVGAYQLAGVQQLSQVLVQLKEGRIDFLEFVRVLSEIDSEDLKQLPKEVRTLIVEITDLALKGAQAARNLKDLKTGFDDLTDSLKVLDDIFADSFGQTIVAAIQAVIDKVGGLNEALYQIRNTLGGLGDFIGTTWNEVGKSISSAADLIKDEEKFRPGAYWDVNAFRTGFGSDTFVDAMGKVQKVTKDTVVTLDQANRDLNRRIGEFQTTIVGQIGPDIWRSLEEQQQAALTSIAYNYGSLPRSIVKAIREGDRGQVAAAIAGLSANPERRRREARLFAGSGEAANEPLKRIETAEKALKDLADWNVETERRIELEKQVADINARYWETQAQRTAQIEALRIAEEQLNERRKAGLTVTAEQEAQIRSLAQAQAEVSVKSRENAEVLKNTMQRQQESAQLMQQTAQQISQLAQSAIGGFIQDLRNGVDAGEAFNNMLGRIIDSLIQMSLQAIFQPAGQAGGLFGALFGLGGGAGGIPATFPFMQKGGVVGDPRVPRRRVDPRAFIGAPRFAAGGVVGLKAGEVPIIAHRGEIVIPRMAARATGSGGGDVNNSIGAISVSVAPGPDQNIATTRQGLQLSRRITEAVRVVLVDESRPGGILGRQRMGAAA